MFDITGKKKYKISYIRGGKGKNEYTFLTLETDLKKGQKYPERLKVNVWGKNLENDFAVGNYVNLIGANEFGIVKQQDKNDPNKWYDNMTAVCSAEHIVLTQVEEERPKQETMQPIDDAEELPF